MTTTAAQTSEKGWTTRTLNDGRELPEIGYGSWLIGSGGGVVDQVEMALDVGFDHIDTAEIYRNQEEVGEGIKASGLARDDVWITTKWSGMNGNSIRTSVADSLRYLGVKYLDLYLIHSPRLCKDDPVGAWQEFQKLKSEGLTKSIGVSNYGIADLEVLRLAGCETPAVNQILLHPYVYASTAPLLAYHATHNIVTEAYSALIPLTKRPGGPVDVPLKEIGERRGVSSAQVLFAWCRAKGAVVVTTSSQRGRLEDYLDAGHLVLTAEEIAAIDLAGTVVWSWTLSVRKERILPTLAMAVSLVGLKMLWSAYC